MDYLQIQLDISFTRKIMWQPPLIEHIYSHFTNFLYDTKHWKILKPDESLFSDWTWKNTMALNVPRSFDFILFICPFRIVVLLTVIFSAAFICSVGLYRKTVVLVITSMSTYPCTRQKEHPSAVYLSEH